MMTRILVQANIVADSRIRSATGAILAANAAACAMYGRSEAELQATPRDPLIDLSDPRVVTMAAQRLATGSARGAIRMRRADGSSFEADVATSTYFEPGSAERMVASVIVRDITERQRLTRRLPPAVGRPLDPRTGHAGGEA